MEFIKNWLIWLILGVIVIACLVVRLVFISSYVVEEEESTKRLLDFQKTAEKKVGEVRRKKIPTQGDIKQAEEMLKDIENEWAQTAEKWKNASVWLEKQHGKDPEQEYSVFLMKSCTKLCDKLAIAKMKAIYGKDWKPGDNFNINNVVICDRENHQIADLTKDFHSVEETMETWKQYLISYKIHQICAKTNVVIEKAKVLDKDKSTIDTPVFKDGSQIRAIEYLGPIEFGEVITAEAANGEEKKNEGHGHKSHHDYNNNKIKIAENKSKIYHDTYPVSFEVTAHIKVIQEIMKNILRADSLKLVFVPVKCEISRFSDSETKPGVSSNNSEGKNSPGIKTDLSYINEPPVKAKLSYNIYHFRLLKEDKKDENKK